MLRGKLQRPDEDPDRRRPEGHRSPTSTRTSPTASQHSVWYMADVAACLRDARRCSSSTRTSAGFEIVVAAGAGAGQGAAAKPPVEASHRHEPPRRQVRLDHPVVRQADDRRDGPRVGRDPHAPLPEVAGVLLPGRVPGPVAVGVPQTPTAAWIVRSTTCYVFEFDPNRALTLVAEYGIRLGRVGRHHSRRGDRGAAQLSADLRLRRRAHDPARRFGRCSTGPPPASARPRSPALELARCWLRSTSTPSRRSSTSQTFWRRSSRSRTSAPW